jgi:acetylglutamate kinase
MEEAIRKAAVLIEAMPYIQRFAGSPVVIKFGGGAMESQAVLDDVLEDVVFLALVGVRPVVVHGGGPQISEAMRQQGLSPRFVHGHRVTDAQTLDVVVRVLTQEISAQVVRGIERHGGRAVSSFTDGANLLRARKKTLLDTSRQPAEQVDVGFVGEVVSVDGQAARAALDAGAVLVVPPIAQDGTGQLYNVNADTAAAAVAVELAAEKIVFLSNVHGIMADPDRPDSLLSSVEEQQVEELVAKGVVTGGMLPKVAACLRALEGGVRKAHIIDGRLPHSLLLEIFTDRGVGTMILRHGSPG